MNQEIKVTKCSDCPMCEQAGYGFEYLECKNGGFKNEFNHRIPFTKGDTIHPNCPLKGKTITYKIGENE